MKHPSGGRRIIKVGLPPQARNRARMGLSGQDRMEKPIVGD